MAIAIKEANSAKQIRDFIKFPFTLYKDSKYWVPPLISDEIKNLSKDTNPAFDFCESQNWLVYKDNVLAGRITAIINSNYNKVTNQKSGRFCNFDFIDDKEVSDILLKTAEKWLKEKGMDSIHGPLGFTDMDPEGMLIEGFDELGTIATIYNYPYYQKHIEDFGYVKDIDWIEYELYPGDDIPEKIQRIADIVQKRYELRLLEVKKSKDLLPYAKEIFYVLNAAYKNIYGFVELTDKQIDLYVKQYFGFIKPGYVPVILNKNNEVVAFGITMPSLSEAFQKAKGKLFPFGLFHILKALKHNHRVDLYLTGVRPDYQDKGVNAMMICEMNKVYSNHNIKLVESNPELESNAKIQAQWRFYKSRQHKRRRCYKKQL